MQVSIKTKGVSDWEQTLQLTPTERQICDFLARGNTREDLKRLLDLNDNALKWHLKQIYAKTVGDNPRERDKLHKLTVMLWRLRGA